MRTSRFPSYAVSALLHLALFLAAYITWPMWSKPITFSEAVPITIVASAPVADIRPAEKAEQAQTAAAPEPVPTPEPAPEPAPQPKPAPPPPAPTPKPQPAPKPPPPKPAPQAKPQPQELNLDQLAAGPKTKTAKPTPKSAPLDLSALAAAPKGARSNAPRGAARPETDFLARLAVGQAKSLTSNELASMMGNVYSHWPLKGMCDVEGARSVRFVLRIQISNDGSASGYPVIISKVGAKASEDTINALVQRGILAAEQTGSLQQYPRGKQLTQDLPFDVGKRCAD